MQRHCGAFKLWIIAMDNQTEEALGRLKPAGVEVIPVTRLETKDLLEVKANRSSKEYCWTITPFAPSAVFDRDSSVTRVTYVDADVWLRRNPGVLFREFEQSGKASMITEHAFAPEYDTSETAGRFCVQFMPFMASESQEILARWQFQCLEWCYDYVEDGKFGDQKYLDSWPDEFADQVHVLSRPSLIQGPWNATRFPFSEAIAYHFHGIRWLGQNRLYRSGYVLPAPLLQYVYEPYASDLFWARDLILDRLGKEYEGSFHQTSISTFRRWISSVRWRVRTAFSNPVNASGRMHRQR